MAETKNHEISQDKTTTPDVKQDKRTTVDGKETAGSEKTPLLVLKGAASLVSRGKKFVKGVPQKVEDPELAKRLLASGLFKTAGDTK